MVAFEPGYVMPLDWVEEVMWAELEVMRLLAMGPPGGQERVSTGDGV